MKFRSVYVYIVQASWFAVATSKEFTNPVVQADSPDPGVAYIDGTYYEANTGLGPDGPFALRKSLDGVSWSVLGSVLTSKPSWTDGRRFWAPEIHEITHGQINVYYTASNASGVLSIGVAHASSPTGPFEDSGRALVLDDIGAIDATYFAENGKSWLLWKTDGNAVGSPCEIKVRELQNDGLAFAPGSHESVLLTNDRSWEADVVEAPWVYRHGQYLWLFYSGSGYADSRYAVGVARAKSITGPWLKASAPVLSQYASDQNASVRQWAGPGHCSVLRVGGSGKNATMIVYHAWRAESVGAAPGRLMMIDEVVWEAEADGWPRIGQCGTPTQELQLAPAAWNRTARPSECGMSRFGVVRLETTQWKDHVISEDGTINGNTSTWRVMNGLAPGGTISLESTQHPGRYLRHRNGALELSVPDGTLLFAQDASWMARPGLLTRAKGTLSLRSVNYPHNFVRHRNGQLVIDTFVTGDELYASDATWRVLDAS